MPRSPTFTWSPATSPSETALEHGELIAAFELTRSPLADAAAVKVEATYTTPVETYNTMELSAGESATRLSEDVAATGAPQVPHRPARLSHFPCPFVCNNDTARAFPCRAARETVMTSRDPHNLTPLLERALAGDVRAWNDFFAEIRRYVHAEVRRAAGPEALGPLEYSAIVQSTLRRVWERLGDQFPDGAGNGALPRFLAWVKTIAHNRTRDEWRKCRRRPSDAVGDVAGQRPGSAARREQVAIEVAAALARLPEKKRQVVELFWFERLSDAEIGGRLGCSAGAVRVLRCRALRELRSPSLLALLEE